MKVHEEIVKKRDKFGITTKMACRMPMRTWEFGGTCMSFWSSEGIVGLAAVPARELPGKFCFRERDDTSVPAETKVLQVQYSFDGAPLRLREGGYTARCFRLLRLAKQRGGIHIALETFHQCYKPSELLKSYVATFFLMVLKQAFLCFFVPYPQCGFDCYFHWDAPQTSPGWFLDITLPRKCVAYF